MGEPSKRIRMTVKTARLIRTELVERVFKRHSKSDCFSGIGVGVGVCFCESDGILPLATFLDNSISIGRISAHLDLACPYLEDDSEVQIQLLRYLISRLWVFPFKKDENTRTVKAVLRIRREIEAFANRNAMQVIAEASR